MKFIKRIFGLCNHDYKFEYNGILKDNTLHKLYTCNNCEKKIIIGVNDYE